MKSQIKSLRVIFYIILISLYFILNLQEEKIEFYIKKKNTIAKIYII